MLSEDHELLGRRRHRRWDRTGAVRRRGLTAPVHEGSRCEDLAQEPGQLLPLPVLAAAPHLVRELLEPSERIELRLQLLDRSGGGRLVEDLFLLLNQLLLRGLVEVVLEVFIPLRHVRGNEERHGASSTNDLQLPKPCLQALATSSQRVVDRVGRRGETTLKDREREPDRARASIVL